MLEHSESEDCWCRPTVQIEGYETFVYHNRRRLNDQDVELALMVEDGLPPIGTSGAPITFTWDELEKLLLEKRRKIKRRLME